MEPNVTFLADVAFNPRQPDQTARRGAFHVIWYEGPVAVCSYPGANGQRFNDGATRTAQHNHDILLIRESLENLAELVVVSVCDPALYHYDDDGIRSIPG